MTGFPQWPSAIFKIPDVPQWLVVATEPRVIDEIWKAPEGVLSSMASLEESLQVKYTLGEQITKNPYHTPIVRAQLTRALPQLVPEIHEEVVDAFNDSNIPLTDDWTAVKASETFMNIVCRASNRIFVACPLCRNPDFVALNVQFTIDVVQTSTVLRLVPRFIRPLVNKLISNVPKRMRHGLRHLAPLVADRRKQREEKGDNYEKPVDFLMWLFDEAKGKEATDWYLTSRILTINFVAIHTSSMTFTQGLYYLAAFPEYLKPLRKEAEEIIKREGWTKAATDQMYKIDSFIKESRRLHPLGMHKPTSLVECAQKINPFSVTMQRIAIRNHTFCEGTAVPRRTAVAVSVQKAHLNEKVYPDALNFDPFRFAELREQETTGRKYDMATTSVDSLAFGHGRHACPGRFFAACELKLMLAHLVMNYDVKFENEGVRPKDMWVVSLCIPNPNAKVLFRKRVV